MTYIVTRIGKLEHVSETIAHLIHLNCCHFVHELKLEKQVALWHKGEDINKERNKKMHKKKLFVTSFSPYLIAMNELNKRKY